MDGPAAVNIIQTASHLAFAAFPGRWQAELFRAVASPLPVDLSRPVTYWRPGSWTSTPSSIPPQIICNAGWLEHTKGDYLFYYEGTTPSVGRVIDVLDEERRAVADAAGVATRPFVQLFCELGYTTEAAAARGTAHAALQESAPEPVAQGSAQPRPPLPPRGRRVRARSVGGVGPVPASPNARDGRPDHDRLDPWRP